MKEEIAKFLSENNVVLGAIASVFVIAGGVWGLKKWGADAWHKLRAILNKVDGISYPIPRKTITAVQKHTHDNWWHMGKSAGKPAMQIVGHFTVTNLTRYNILLAAVRMRKPNTMGHIMIKKHDQDIYGNYLIPDGAITEMSFDFWIVPPVKKEGEIFSADIAVVDQFGNEHWIKKAQFRYT